MDPKQISRFGQNDNSIAAIPGEATACWHQPVWQTGAGPSLEMGIILTRWCYFD